MRSIISIVGKSHSGKTTLLEKLIGELKGRGYRVAVVKHSHHADDPDTADKDTWRFTRAGSALSAINSPGHLAIYRRTEHHFDPQEIAGYVHWDYDFILTEGFKSSRYPKIETHRREQGEELLTDPADLLAVVTDTPLDINVPQFAHDDVSGIANIIERKMIEQRRDNEVDLLVNGAPVPLTPDLGGLITRTLLAMIPRPDGHGIKDLQLSLRRTA